MNRRAHHLALLTLALAMIGGCGDEEPGECAGDTHEPQCLVCNGDEDEMAAGTTKAGETFTIEIVSSDPSPHLEGNNDLRVRVLDADGAPVDGVDFTKVEPFYPPGGHGTPIVPEVTATGTAGEYDIARINYIHEGRWELRFELASGASTDAILFVICVAAPDGDAGA
jgi:hypothetical protein